MNDRPRFWLESDDGWTHPVGFFTREDAQAQLDLWTRIGLATAGKPRIVEKDYEPPALGWGDV